MQHTLVASAALLILFATVADAGDKEDLIALDKRWAYPLRALNAFEVVYWFALVSGIHYYARKEKKIVWLIVACSYILIFLLWLVFYVIVYK